MALASLLARAAAAALAVAQGGTRVVALPPIAAGRVAVFEAGCPQPVLVDPAVQVSGGAAFGGQVTLSMSTAVSGEERLVIPASPLTGEGKNEC